MSSFRGFYILGVALLFGLLALVGCQGVVPSKPSDGEGLARLSVRTVSQTVEVQSRNIATDQLIYNLVVRNMAGDTVFVSRDVTEIVDIRLSAGTYEFIAESGADSGEARIDAPYFRGVSEVNIQPLVSTEVGITARLANARVSATFTDIFNDTGKVLSYRLGIDGVFLSKEDLQTGRSLYISPTLGDDSGAFTWLLEVINGDGHTISYTRRITGVEPCTHYKLSFDIDQDLGDFTGSADFDFTITNQMEEVRDDVTIDPSLSSHNTIRTVGFTTSEQLTVRATTPRHTPAEFHLEPLAAGNPELRDVILMHDIPALQTAGVARNLTLSLATDQQLQALMTAGIEVLGSIADYQGGGLLSVDATSFASTALVGTYNFTMMGIEHNGSTVSSHLLLKVLPDSDHLNMGVQAETLTAIFNGQWCTEQVPDGLTFQYRVANTEEWTTVPADVIEIVCPVTKTYRARVKGLQHSTTYQMRTYTPEAQYPNEVEFTTYTLVDLPNMSMDEGYYSGDTWYPNASGGNSFWATGNEGLTGFGVWKPSNTTHTDDAVSGKAVYMESVGGIPMVDVAAGNLFTGTYKTNMSNPAASVEFGRPYSGRPLGMRGWYKYTPAMISSTESDFCHVYILLEDDKGTIGYGEFRSCETVTEYTQFEFEITYTRADVPTKISCAATSSHKGGDFICGIGSKMWIDEMELIWE